MFRKFTGFLYLFIFATLFLFVGNHNVMAVTIEEMLDSNHEIYRYESSTKMDDGITPLSSYEAIKLPYKKAEVYDENEGRLKSTDGTNVRYQISYMENGKMVSYEPSFGFDGADDRLILKLSKEISEGTTYRLNIIIPSKNSGDDEDEVKTGQKKEFKLTDRKTQIEAKATSFVGTVWTALTGKVSEKAKIVVETFCRILIPIGDSFLDMVCNAMGEVVTIDGAVYNRISKVDIDYFSKSATTGTGLKTPLKETMKVAVNRVYGFFRNIVIVVFLSMLVYIGIKILYTSTASKKANYKSLLMAWVMGVTMLAFFPYVMKYSIELNDALCKMISGSSTNYDPKAIEGLAPFKYKILYGTDDFVKHMLGNGEKSVNDNAMLSVRYIGAKTWSIPMLIVYFIFIGQLCAILVMYYKRVFMIGFLIAIFPIVALIYPLSKIGAVKANPFGVWFKEFMVNVFVQTFHAATYKVVVTLGVGAYQQSQNWLFMIICVLFLFEGEKLLRAIFNAKSSASTIGDMAMAGAFAMNMMKSVGSAIPSANKKDDDKDDELSAKEKANKDLNRFSSTPSTTRNMQAVVGLAAVGGVTTGALSGAAGSRGATTTTVTSIPSKPSTSNGNASTTGANMIDKNIQNTKKDKKIGTTPKSRTNLAGTVFNIGAQVTGGIIGTTYGLAQTNNKEGFNAATSGLVSGVSTGKAVGHGVKGFVTSAVDKVSTREAAKIVAKDYADGKYDDQIGITEADRQLNSAKAEAIRKAYAKYAKRSTGVLGKSVAQLSFYRDRMKIVKEDLDRKND